MSSPEILQLLWDSNPGQPDPEAHPCPPNQAVFILPLIFIPWPRVAHGPLVPICCGVSGPVGTFEVGRELRCWPQSVPSGPGPGPHGSLSSCFWVSGRMGWEWGLQETGLEPAAATKSVEHTTLRGLSGPCAMLLCPMSLVCLLMATATHSDWRNHSTDAPPPTKLQLLEDGTKSGLPWNPLDPSTTYRSSRRAC